MCLGIDLGSSYKGYTGYREILGGKDGIGGPNQANLKALAFNQPINHLFQCRQCWTNIHVLDLFDAPLTPCAHGSRDILHRRTLSPASSSLYQVLGDICFWF